MVENISVWFQGVLDQTSENAGIILTAFLFILVGFYIARLISRLIVRGLRYRKVDAELTLLLSRITQWAIIIGVILFSAQQVGVNVTAILAGLGILGFTLGFALQDVSKNFIAGLLLLLQQPFKLGDTIQVSGFSGTIIDINLRDTEIRTMDGLRVRIPNGEIFTQPVLNYTGVKQRRLHIKLGVAYDTDLERARQNALEAIKAIPGVLEDPEVVVHFESFGDFAIQMNIFYWYDESRTSYPVALDAGIRGIKSAFEAAGIIIPFPVHELKMVNEGDALSPEKRKGLPKEERP
ncbi:MAG TPA: mechanosensitive ion channel family protein [Anaerolineales bacterium]|nr:mechanosensitive ion channel family protein [Anaerolineales bacterium]